MIETRKTLLDHLVKMHDQYLTDVCRHSKRSYEKKHREHRKRQKRAIDRVLDATHTLINWTEETIPMETVWKKTSKEKLVESINDLRIFKYLEERGYGDLLLARYPSLRKYFVDFVRLPFESESGSSDLMGYVYNMCKK